jgi:hypothetical protein
MNKFNLIPETQKVDQGRSQEVSDILGARNQAYQDSLKRDPETARLLKLLEGGLGGLTATENTLMRERGEEGLDRGLQTNLRALAGVQRGSGVRGAAANASLMDMNRERLMAGRGLERDIQLENINVQDRRRAGYGSQLESVLGREFGQRQSALGALEGSTGLARADELQREMFNIGQDQNTAALRGSTMFGLVGLRGGRRATAEAVALEKERLAAEREWAAQQHSAVLAQIDAMKGMMG